MDNRVRNGCGWRFHRPIDIMNPAYTLITGSTSGIGLSIAHKLYPGRRLILHGRQPDKLDALRQTFPDALFWECNLALPDIVEASLTRLLKAQGAQVQSLVYCAGIAPLGPLKALSIANWEQVMNVNLTSAMLLTKALTSVRLNAKALKSIVFISSNLSGFGARGMCAYAASKAGLDGLMKSLAMELAPRVRVNSVLPGAIRTPMTEKILADVKVQERMQNSYPLGLGQPEDIANVIEFLLSDASNWITGQQLTVDGGRTTNLSARKCKPATDSEPLPDFQINQT